MIFIGCLLLAIASWRCSARVFSEDRVLAAMTLFASLLAFSVTSLGYLELLFERPFLSGFSVLCTSGITSLFLVWSSQNRQPKTNVANGAARGLFFWLCIGMLLFVFGLAAVVAFSSPPRGYDALWFHLPLADHFYRTGSLLPETTFKWFWHPANMNLLFSSLLPFTRGSALHLPGLLFLVLITYLSANIYRRISPDEKRGPLLIALWIATTPCYFFLSILVLTDLPSIALTTLALYWFIAWYQKREAPLLLLMGLSIGLALGTKTAALPVFAGFCVLLAFEIFWERIQPKEAFSWFGLFLLGAFVAGGYWYIRNGVMRGNPFHPLSIAVGPFQLGAEDLGLIDPSKERWWLGGEEWWRWFAFPFSSAWYSHEWGLGLLPGIFVLVGFFLLPVSFWSRRTQPLTRALLFLIVLHLIGWWAASRHFRHLLLLWPIALPILLRLFLRVRGAWLVAFLWSFFAMYTLVDITLFTNRWEQSIEEEPDWHAYYGLPSDYEEKLPEGTVIANLIGEPNHFPMLGIDGRYRVLGYNDAARKSAEQLREMGASYALSLHRANAKPSPKEGFTLVEEWPLPKRFRWWGFFRREYAVVRLWRLGG
jgi:hypothetical protein